MRSVFRRSAPLLASSFINRCGTIGLSLLPMLLVERGVSAPSAAWVMGLVKGASLAGTFLGGWICDRIPPRLGLVIAFGLSGAGMAALPWIQPLWAITLLAMLAQAGHSMYPGTARTLMLRLIPLGSQQESIGWLRTANNLGQIVAFTVGWAFSGLGIAVLMLLDGVTSFLAAGVGLQVLPEVPRNGRGSGGSSSSSSSGGDSGGDGHGNGSQLRLLLAATLITGGFSFLFELFLTGAAARFRLVFGEGGLRLFSQAMLANTAICAALSIGAARFFTNPNHALPLGLGLATIGCLLTFAREAGYGLLLAGVLVMTLGEVVFMSVSSYLVMRLTPESRHSGAIYGGALVIQVLGRIAGGAAAFPLAVGDARSDLPILVAGALSFLLWWGARRGFSRRFGIGSEG